MLDKAVKLNKDELDIKGILSKKQFWAIIAAIAVLMAAIIASASISPKETEIKTSVVITEKKDYKIENLFCEALSEKAIADGWKYYYVESADNGAQFTDWVPSDKTVPVELSLDVTNLSKDAVKFTERMYCKLIYDNKEFATSVMQENPGQKTANGEKCRSLVGTAVKKDETVKIWFMADIPVEILNSDLPFEAVITVEKSVYKVNLRENMKIFSE